MGKWGDNSILMISALIKYIFVFFDSVLNRLNGIHCERDGAPIGFRLCCKSEKNVVAECHRFFIQF